MKIVITTDIDIATYVSVGEHEDDNKISLFSTKFVLGQRARAVRAS